MLIHSLQSGPDGAVSGSSWACRETFVAIIVTNLPIVHPLLRSAARALSLGSLISSRHSKSRSQSYPLQSNVGIEHKNTSRKSRQHPLSLPDNTAWGSDEHILPVASADNSTSKEAGGGIVVAQEVSVRSESAQERGYDESSGRLRGDGWALKSSASAAGNIPRAHL